MGETAEHKIYPRHLALDEATPPPIATTDPRASKGRSMGGSSSPFSVVLRKRSRKEGRREGCGDGGAAADSATGAWLIVRLCD